jgi:cation:H+ antiporter
MEVILAKNAGFCPGVKRADLKIRELIENRTKDEHIFTLGKLIHNDSYVSELEAKGEEEEVGGNLIKDIIFIIVGALVIAVGADLLVDSAKIIAADLGMSESVIALTVVALGTSLPELVTAITSLIKGHGALSLGNIIGANIFNLVLVSGVAVTISPFKVPVTSTLFGANTSLVLDIPVMLAVMAIMTIPTILRGKLARWQGILLLSIYFAFTLLQFIFVKNVA